MEGQHLLEWGVGIAEQEDQQLEPPMLAPDKQLLKTAVREHRKFLNQLAKQPWAPTQQLTEEEQEYVAEERLRRRLRKFWGLMHEADRPWHRDIIIYLCCSLPPRTRSLYRKLKPSTLQHIVAQRCKVEKSLHSSAERCRWHIRRLQGWWKDALQASLSIPTAQQQIIVEQMDQMRRELVWVRAEVGRQQEYARASFLDEDHIQYCQEHLRPVIDELEAVNDACCNVHLPRLEQGQAILQSKKAHGEGMQSPRKVLFSALGPMDLNLSMPCYSSAQWRYPPGEWVRVRQKAPLLEHTTT